MSAELRFYGHAVLRAGPAEGPASICDPWFSRTGAFFRSWFQFPENAELEAEAFSGLRDVLISHNHQDHYDPEVLARALERSPELRLHVAAFATSWFQDRIAAELPESRGLVQVHPAFERFDIAGGQAYFVPEESPGQIDSAIVLEIDGRTIVNMNDARLNSGQLERILERAKGSIAMLALQASGASEYPVNYLYDPADMLARKEEKRRLKFEACERIIDALRPERLLFFAGPPVFLDPALAAHNDISEASVFPDQLDILKHYETARGDIAARSYFALPGDLLSDALLWSRTDLEDPRFEPFTRKLDYIDAYRKRRTAELDFEAVDIGDEEQIRAHFETMAGLSEFAAERIGGTITFVVEGRDRELAFSVDFRERKVSEGETADPLYLLRLPMAALEDVLDGRATWDDIFLSLRMTFDERSPRFVAHFKTLLKYMDPQIMDALATYESRLSRKQDDDFMTVEEEGRCYRFQRHCPHAGVDLEKHGRVNGDGTITCMAHRFQFDMKSGRCLNVAGFQLAVKPS